MRKFFSLFLLINLVGRIYLLEFSAVDSSFLLGLFTKTKNVNVIKIDNQIPADTTNEIERTTPAFFEEQCALECLRNVYCVRFVFTEEKSTCVISIRLNFERQSKFNPAQNSKITDHINCDLQACSKSLYCSPLNDTQIGNCLCDTVTTTGKSCANKVKYEFSEWSTWSACSVACDGGFRNRNRKCIKKYFNPAKNENVTEVMDNMEWLCDMNYKISDVYDIQTCNVNRCRFYSEWSSWSPCDKICDGFKSRFRSCEPGVTSELCNPVYLKDIQMCSSFEDCSSTIISKYFCCFGLFLVFY